MLEISSTKNKHQFKGPFSRTTWVSQYQKGKTNQDFTEARDSEWQWHQLDHMQVCTSLETDNHASTPSLSFYRPDALSDVQLTVSKHSVTNSKAAFPRVAYSQTPCNSTVKTSFRSVWTVNCVVNWPMRRGLNCIGTQTKCRDLQQHAVVHLHTFTITKYQRRHISTKKKNASSTNKQLTSYRPGGGETICPRRWQFDSRWTYVRPRTSPQTEHLWCPASCRQPACLYPRSCAMGQTDGRIMYRLMPPYGGGIIPTIKGPRTGRGIGNVIIIVTSLHWKKHKTISDLIMVSFELVLKFLQFTDIVDWARGRTSSM